MTTYGEALAAARVSLSEAGVESAALDARLLLASASGLDMAALIARGRDDLPPVARSAFDTHMKRRLNGEPVARILGEKEFWGLPIKVGGAALVPRAETETLVEIVLAEARRRFRRGVAICDLGTGSGAILVALLKELPVARGLGTDISEEALAIARLNAERHGVANRAAFECVSFAQDPYVSFEGAFLKRAFVDDVSFDVVVANPPYIKSDAIDALQPEVRDYDPRAALDGGADGLAAYRVILGRIDSLLREGGLLGFEVGYDQSESVAALCREAGLSEINVHADLAGLGRVVTAARTIEENARETAKKALGKVEQAG